MENTLKRVYGRLKDEKDDANWTLIATSCVEAGVGLSFRNGFRELCPLSSLLQTSGRTDREGIYGDSMMWTFVISEDGMLKANPALRGSGGILKENFESGATISPELVTDSILREVAMYGMNRKGDKIAEGEEYQDFPEVERLFKVIDSDTRLAVVDDEIAAKVERGEMDWQELQRESVRIAKYKLDDLNIPTVAEGIYHWNRGYDPFLGYMAGVVNTRSTDDR